MDNAKEKLERLESILKKSAGGTKKEMYQPPYGDPTELNTSRVIMDSVGKDLLEEITADYLDLLETSGAIYEKNGDYALGIFSSGWCQFMDMSARKLCSQKDLKEALDSGKWECHESCWNEASRESIVQKKPVDIECRGGIRLYAVPVFVEGEAVGSINFGYGDPPKNPERLKELAQKYNISVEELIKKANEYESRPQYIIDMAKRRLQMAAKFIGAIVELKQHNEEIEKMNQKFTGRELEMIKLKGRIKELEEHKI